MHSIIGNVGHRLANKIFIGEFLAIRGLSVITVCKYIHIFSGIGTQWNYICTRDYCALQIVAFDSGIKDYEDSV